MLQWWYFSSLLFPHSWDKLSHFMKKLPVLQKNWNFWNDIFQISATLKLCQLVYLIFKVQIMWFHLPSSGSIVACVPPAPPNPEAGGPSSLAEAMAVAMLLRQNCHQTPSCAHTKLDNFRGIVVPHVNGMELTYSLSSSETATAANSTRTASVVQCCHRAPKPSQLVRLWSLH